MYIVHTTRKYSLGNLNEQLTDIASNFSDTFLDSIKDIFLPGMFELGYYLRDLNTKEGFAADLSFMFS